MPGVPSRVVSPTLGAVAIVALVAAGCAKRVRPAAPTAPAQGAASFIATAYCTGTVTASGVRPAPRTVAADTDVLPMGSRIRISGADGRYDGVYTVTDTGASIRGRRIDLYMRNCDEAIKFGRRPVQVRLLR